MPLGSLLDKVFTIGVVHKPRNPFRKVQMIGTAKIGKLLKHGSSILLGSVLSLSLFFLRPPWGLPAGSEAPPAGFRIPPAGSKAHPA